MRNIFYIILFIGFYTNIHAQQTTQDSIKRSIVGLLKWHKVNHLHDPSPKRYTL